ncbi:MAG: hypothetical protein RLZZ303_1706 [Candidatus Hydrogenedentota bacterium]
MGESRLYLSPGDWSILTSLAFGGMLLYLFVVIYGTVGTQDRFIRFDAPGVIEFDLEWSGTYIVYHEFDRTADNKGEIRPAQGGALVARLQAAGGGAMYPVEPAPEGHEYKMQRMLAEGMYQFTVEQAGRYRFVTEYKSGDGGAPIRMVIIPTPAGRALRVFYLGTAMAVLIFVGVLGLAYLMNRRGRRRFEQAVRA